MTFTKNKEGEGVGCTKFWSVLLMVVHGFEEKVFFLLLWTPTCAVSKSLCFRDMKRFLIFIWLFSVTLLPRGSFNLQFSYRNKRSTKTYHESRLN